MPSEIGKYDPHVLEPDILKYWEEKKVYGKITAKTKGKKPYYFLDGPPYTSGRIHLGLGWNKSMKDMLYRYKRSKGFSVYDRAGYDMHGLPTENKVQQKLGLKHKDDIPVFGMKKFIEECRAFALEQMGQMNKDFVRLGVWMDFANAYKPIDHSFIEGEWWLIKKAHENKRLYEGLKTMTWCANCATALAKHELEYENVEDDSIFVKFRVKGKENEYLIIWTTTPWTIPYNLAVMANPNLEYVRAKVGDEVWVLSKGLAASVIGMFANHPLQIMEEFMGDKLKGLEYEHPFADTVKDYEDIGKHSKKLHTVVLSEEYVDLSAGTGLVHCAPGCGPEDYEVGYREGLPPYNNLDEYGVFPESMGKFAGFTAKKDDQKFVEELKSNGALIAVSRVEHDYAHCWRCKKPVIFKTTKQWFFRIEDLKDKMRELNRKILWVPDWAGNSWFDSWLDNLRDNGITRQRYWGTPLPIWRCGKCQSYDVIGSIDELKHKAGKLPEDLHIPYIDEITYKCKCGGEKKRIPDILDVWIDAGTTSWTCLNYPQDKELFKKLYPPDFILEGKDQIRGWFNMLFVASMISMEVPAYKAVYMHGFINDAQGRKMSKSLGNIISPYEVIDKYGADTLRYYMIGGTQPGIDINYNFDDMKVKHRNLGILWNLHKYVIDYAKTIGANPAKIKKIEVKDAFEIEEKFMLSKLNSTIKEVTALFDAYNINQIPWKVEELFLEMSRTYIQLIREKSASGTEQEKQTILYIIYNTLMDCITLLAPVAPFITEQIYLNLRKAFELKPLSLSFYPWPDADDKLIDAKLESQMVLYKDVLQAALNAREKAGFGVRWPLKEMIIVSENNDVEDMLARLGYLLKNQVNVKDIKLMERFDKVRNKIMGNYNAMAPEFREISAAIIGQLALESPEAIVAHLKREGKHKVSVDGKKFTLKNEHVIIERQFPDSFAEGAFSQGYVYLNKERSDELESEGYARELIRRVQAARATAGLERRDRIVLFICANEDLKEMLDTKTEYIKEKVGAEKREISQMSPYKVHKHNFKDKIKDYDFEAWFDKG